MLLVEEHGTRQVLRALWGATAGADDDTEAGWKRDLSWLSELERAEISWSIAGVDPYLEVDCRGRILEVALSFHVQEKESGWVLASPASTSTASPHALRARSRSSRFQTVLHGSCRAAKVVYPAVSP